MTKTLNINRTFEILNGYLMCNNKLNVDYLTDQIYIVCNNTESMHNLLYNTRKKSLNIALEWVLYFINTELTFAGYQNNYANLYHIKAYEKAHPEMITVIENLTKIIDELKLELIEG